MHFRVKLAVAGGLSLLLGLFILSKYPEYWFGKIAQMVMEVVITALGLSIGGAIGAILAASREIADAFQHQLKTFKAGVLVNRHELKNTDFFDDINAQKYCCEGVIGSATELKQVMDQCFLNTCLVFFLVIWSIGCTFLAVRALILGEVSWTFPLITASAVVNTCRLLLPILKFNLKQELRVEVPRLKIIADQMKQLQDPEYKLPPIILQANQVAGRGRRRDRANFDVAPVIQEETPEQHEARKQLQLDNLKREKDQYLRNYPYLADTNMHQTQKMGYLMPAMFCWLVGICIAINKILLWGFGIDMMFKQKIPASQNATDSSVWIDTLTNTTVYFSNLTNWTRVEGF